jgi:cyclase
MPLTSGGKIGSLKDIEIRLSSGADKVMINSSAFTHLEFLSNAVKNFGSQCISVSIDVKKIDGTYKIFIQNGTQMVKEDLSYWIKKLNGFCVGEILLNSIEKDGAKSGYDLELINYVAGLCQVPLIVCGGAGTWNHFESALRVDGVDAVAAANIFQHIDQSVYLAHDFLYNRGLPVRKPQLLI